MASATYHFLVCPAVAVILLLQFYETIRFHNIMTAWALVQNFSPVSSRGRTHSAKREKVLYCFFLSTPSTCFSNVANQDFSNAVYPVPYFPSFINVQVVLIFLISFAHRHSVKAFESCRFTSVKE